MAILGRALKCSYEHQVSSANKSLVVYRLVHAPVTYQMSDYVTRESGVRFPAKEIFLCKGYHQFVLFYFGKHRLRVVGGFRASSETYPLQQSRKREFFFCQLICKTHSFENNTKTTLKLGIWKVF
jgi:hypothetical protein